MPIIYLKHPIHGSKVATMETEAEHDEAQGWKRYELDTQPAIVEKAIEEVVEEVIAAPVNTLEKRTRRKTAE
jgi:hypothetical protein